VSQRFPQMKDELQWMAVVEAGPQAIERFERMLADGESINTAAMLATQKSPSGGVNDQFVTRNAGSLEQQFAGCPEMLDLYRKNYKAKTGEELPSDAVCYRGLVDEPGDPRYIVTHKNTLADVQRNAREDNKQVEGDWENHPVQQAPVPQSVRINDTSMGRLLADYQSNPAYEKASVEELKEEIIAKHTKVVTADEAMAAPRTLDEIHRRIYH
jgi:hypothetical protein